MQIQKLQREEEGEQMGKKNMAKMDRPIGRVREREEDEMRNSRPRTGGEK